MKTNNNRKKSVLAMLLAGMLLISGCGSQAAAEVMAEETPATAVEVQAAQRSGIVSTLTYVGKVEANKSINISSKAAGTVESVNFDIGDEIKEGDVLFTLDSTTLEYEISIAQANLNKSKASAELGLETSQRNLDNYQSNLEENYNSTLLNAESAVRSAEAALTSAETSLAIAIKNYKNAMDDNDDGDEYGNDIYTKSQMESFRSSITQARQAVEKAEDTLADAQAAYEAIKNAVDQERASYEDGVKSAEITADLSASSISIEQLRNTLKDYTVTAPISGVVSARNIEEGMLLGSGSVPFTVVEMDIVKINVSVSEQVINSLFPGDAVSVYIKTVREEPFNGVITNVSPAADTTNTYPVKIELDNSDRLIKPGMFAEVTFVKDSKDNVFVVDKDAVLNDGERNYVYIVENGTAKKAYVTLGLDNGSEVEILDGLSANDKVVVMGQNFISDGDPVNVVNEPETSEQSQEEEIDSSNLQDEADA